MTPRRPYRSEQRIIPDIAVGKSVGSLNGAAVALGPEGAASRLSHAWARRVVLLRVLSST
jgi:hypothetical protein